MSPGGILVVDDDPIVLAVIGQMLRDQFTAPIFFASTASSACEIWETAETKIEVLVTDMSLNEESGERLAAAFVRFNPLARVIIVSGWDVDREEASRKIGTDVTVLQKPFTASELQMAVFATSGRK